MQAVYGLQGTANTRTACSSKAALQSSVPSKIIGVHAKPQQQPHIYLHASNSSRLQRIGSLSKRAEDGVKVEGMTSEGVWVQQAAHELITGWGERLFLVVGVQPSSHLYTQSPSPRLCSHAQPYALDCPARAGWQKTP